jgi:hypothetical protein
VPSSGVRRRRTLPYPTLQDYALGWFVEVDDGHKVIEHDGGVLGALSALYFIPGRHVAFSICINSEDVATLEALVYELLDFYLDRPPRDWVSVLVRQHERQVRQEQAALRRLPRRNPLGAMPFGWPGTLRSAHPASRTDRLGEPRRRRRRRF